MSQGERGATVDASGGPILKPAEFAAIAAVLQADARIALSEAKITLVQSRLARRLREQNIGSFADYLRVIRSNPAERAAMVIALTTNHTNFFREVHHFDHFRQTVVPELQMQARNGAPRIWSAGCSTGEEAYTIAMCLLGTEAAHSSWIRNANLRILATDLAPHVVEATRNAVYADAAVSQVPLAYRSVWMERVGDSYRMADDARALVTANVLNLFEPWPMRGLFDTIFCRNVMIYFDDAARADLEARLIERLRPGGYLYIGHSERLAPKNLAGMINCGQTVYQKRGAQA